MDQISEERNVPLSQIALNWTLQRPFISSCIIGAQSRDKIEENCKVFEWKLSDDEMQLLEQALKKDYYIRLQRKTRRNKHYGREAYRLI